MKMLLITIIVTPMLGIGEMFAQSSSESAESPNTSVISLIEKRPKGLKVVAIYLGADNDEIRKRHLEWAKMLNLEHYGDPKRFILFDIEPKSLKENSRFASELLKHVGVSKNEDGFVSGIIPVRKNQIELNGKIWSAERKPRELDNSDHSDRKK